jgi:hypothetical protein
MSGISRAAAVGLAVAIAVSASASLAQAARKGSTEGSIEGVWKITNVATSGANAATTSSPQPSVIIFTRGHYAYVSGGSQPRKASPPPKDSNKLTDAEKLAKFEEWDGLTGQAGTFDVKGTTLTRHPTVAKNVAVMTTDGPIAQEFKLKGDSLVLISKSAAGRPASETRTMLTRVR